MRKRVLIDCRNLSYQGSGLCSYVEGILSCLGRYTDNFDFLFLVEDIESIERLKLEYSYRIIIAGCRKSNSFLRDFFEQIIFPLRFIFYKIDIFHGVDYYIPFLPSFYKKVTTIHDCAVFYDFEGRHKIAKAYCRLMQNFSARLSDKIIAITNFGKNEIVKYHKVDSDKIAVVLNGINEYFFEPINKDVESCVNIRIQEFGKYILYYGGYRNHKNVKTLLKAFSQSERIDMKLVLVGSHSAVESFLADYDNDLKNIIVWGFATNEELKCLLDNCEAFIFPSIYEGFGMPIAEAMARKAKIVCKNIEVAREVGNDYVYYFDNHDDLVNIIKNIESIPKKSNSITYHWEDSISEYINLYNNI